MTLKEIARLANVSPSTVSRVINSGNPKAARPETRDRIWEIVRATGYVPNESAQSLRVKEQKPPADAAVKRIYCIFARTVDSYLDPFFTELMQAIQQEAFAKKYIIQTVMSDRELSHIDVQHSSRSCGAIVLGRMNQQTMDTLSALYRHIVYVGLNTLPYKIDQIVCEGRNVARSAVDYLLREGHREILYIGETGDEQRYYGYMDTMEQAGIPDPSRLVVPTSLTPHGGYSAVNRVLDSGMSFSALFCANDDTAIGAVRALREKNISVPQNVSVVGVGDIELSRYFSPMLTTVHIPIGELGRQAAKSIIDRIEGGHRIPMKIELPTSVFVRESSSRLSTPVRSRS